MESPEICINDTFIDPRGLEVEVYQINRARDLVVLRSEQGDFEMSLDSLVQAIEDGDFAELSDDEDEEQEDER
jgi:hypothetical protein